MRSSYTLTPIQKLFAMACISIGMTRDDTITYLTISSEKSMRELMDWMEERLSQTGKAPGRNETEQRLCEILYEERHGHSLKLHTRNMYKDNFDHLHKKNFEMLEGDLPRLGG